VRVTFPGRGVQIYGLPPLTRKRGEHVPCVPPGSDAPDYISPWNDVDVGCGLGLEAVSRRSSAWARSRLAFGVPWPRLGLEF